LQQLESHFSTAEPGKKLGGLKGLNKTVAKLPFNKDKEYDVIVIGGGTGGITMASEARKLGLSVALFDYVSPSNQGSTWGLGGTCLNVGCIPKKLFHIGTQVHETTHMLRDYGWNPHDTKLTHDWTVLRDNI
jgi:thioredoxin reductase (NADPH)